MKKLSLLVFVLLASITTMVAQRTITGTITDEAGMPLIGATVLVQGTSTGAVTGIDGNYSVRLPEGSEVLLFSYTGYSSQEITVGVSDVVDVVLVEDAAILDEVVVTGYSEVESKKLVSSVAVVDQAAIENVPITSVNGLIQGRAAGVYTSQNSGQPGTTQAIRIRGTGSINAGRGPLYVIDGVIIEQGNQAGLDGAQSADILANLNPNDISNVTVLKDASATALYGSRGSNGVILITTKRGKAGKTNITLKGQAGNTSPLFGNFEMMDARQQWEYERQVLANSGFDADQIDGIRPESLLDNTTDWVNAAFRDGQTYNLEAQASGGNDKTRFFGSAGYFYQEGTLIESDFDRLSARLNLDHFASDKLDFSFNFNATYSKQANAVSGNRFQSPILGAFLNTPMQGSVNPATGELYTGLEDDWIPFVGDNFLYSQPLNYVDINTFRLLSKLQMNYNITKNLRFSQTANIDWLTLDEKDFDDPTTNDGINTNGSITQRYNNRQTLTSQSALKYFNTFGDNHNVDALAVFEYQRNFSNNFGATGNGLASGKLQTLSSTAEAGGAPFGSISNYSFLSYLAQINYNFQERYFVTLTGRRDGSSRFGANNRYANFGAVGLGWTLTNEAFLSDSFFDNLRLRASYGIDGNADIGNFASLQLYGFGAAYNGLPGSVPSQIGNPDLTWERNQKLNFGLDFAILDNRVAGTVEYYQRVSNDLLLNVPVSSTAGFTTALRNVGEMENSGVEITLDLLPIVAKQPGGFNWNANFNISFNQNQITKLPEGEDILNGSQIFREGEPIRSIYLQKWAGVNPDDGTPQWETEEGDLTGNYSSADRFIVGNAEPTFVAGLNNTFTFKGISLSAFFYTAQGHSILNSSRRFIESDGQRFGWNHIAAAGQNYWTQPGDIAERPQPLVGGNNNANATSTRYLEDASFIRLRNVTLGYRLPRSVTDRLNLGGVNMYVQGVNLWTLTDYSGFDPEADEDGSEFFRYPVGQSLTFGLDVTF